MLLIVLMAMLSYLLKNNCSTVVQRETPILFLVNFAPQLGPRVLPETGCKIITTNS